MKEADVNILLLLKGWNGKVVKSLMIIVRELVGKQMARICSKKSLLEMIKKEEGLFDE